MASLSTNVLYATTWGKVFGKTDGHMVMQHGYEKFTCDYCKFSTPNSTVANRTLLNPAPGRAPAVCNRSPGVVTCRIGTIPICPLVTVAVGMVTVAIVIDWNR